MARLLLEHGANPNQKGNKGETAFSLAARDHYVDIIRLLRQNRGPGRAAREVGHEEPVH